MKTLEEQLKLCAVCQHRAFSLKTGVTCALTNAKPTFDEDDCPNFAEKGSTAKTTTPKQAQQPAKPAPKATKVKEEPVAEETSKPAAKKGKKPAVKPIEPPKTAEPSKPTVQPVSRPQRPQVVKEKKQVPDEFNTLGNAFAHTIITLLKIIFLTPFNLWMEAAFRLAKQKNEKTLDTKNISGIWSILTFIKRITLDFAFDALTLLSFPIGLITSVVILAKEGFIEFLVSIAVFYFVYPIIFALLHDFITLLLLPIRKYINWGSKPAQYLEINETKK